MAWQKKWLHQPRSMSPGIWSIWGHHRHLLPNPSSYYTGCTWVEYVGCSKRDSEEFFSKFSGFPPSLCQLCSVLLVNGCITSFQLTSPGVPLRLFSLSQLQWVAKRNLNRVASPYLIEMGYGKWTLEKRRRLTMEMDYALLQIGPEVW